MKTLIFFLFFFVSCALTATGQRTEQRINGLARPCPEKMSLLTELNPLDSMQLNEITFLLNEYDEVIILLEEDQIVKSIPLLRERFKTMVRDNTITIEKLISQ